MSMEAQSQTKPPNYNLLNSIRQNETNAGIYLKAWAYVSRDPELCKTLMFVGEREAIHGRVFHQRMERLGWATEPREDPNLGERMRIYCDPNVSDAEKARFALRGLGETDEKDSLNEFFASLDRKANDERIDQLTRDSLRWYVAEERDSVRLLRAAYLKAAGSTSATHADGATPAPSADAQAIMACVSEGFASLQQSIKQLSETMAKRTK